MNERGSDFPVNLNRIQRWMQAVLTHPDGVAPGIDSSEARSLFDITATQAERVATRSRNLTAIERLSVYHNAYYARLLSCLREEFPVFLKTVTEEIFDAFAFDYLQRHPSHSYTLVQLGADFSRYLIDTHREEAEETSDAPGWEQFIIELARLEWIYNEVFDSPGMENETPLDPGELLQISPEKWVETKFTIAPCLRLMTLQFPTHRYYLQARKQDETPIPDACETFLAVTRRNYVVEHFELTRAEFHLLSALAEGQTIGSAIATLLSEDLTTLEELTDNLETWFQRWTVEGCFLGVVLP